MVFPDDGGLAVLVHDAHKAPSPGHELLSSIFEGGDENERGLVSFYRHAALHHAIRLEVLRHGDALNRKQSQR